MFVSFKWLFVATSAFFTGSYAEAASGSEVLACLNSIPKDNSTLITRNSAEYDQDRFGLNYYFSFKPAAIYYPATNAAVAAAIKCAALNNIPVAPRSGGHSYEGYSEGGADGALVLDLKQFQQFSIDASTGIAKVGAGTRLGPLYSRLWEDGKYLFPAGACPSVGIGGHALGGGTGLNGRKYGVATDNIVSMTVVDAKGDILDISATSNPDLFWALRGAGGGSFAIVTEFRLQAYKAPEVVTTFSINYPMDNFSTVIDSYLKWGRTINEDTMAELNVDSNNGITVQGTYHGDADDAITAVAQLTALVGIPVAAEDQDVTPGTWYDAATRWAWLLDGTLADPVIGDVHYWRSTSLLYRNTLSDQEKSIILKYLMNPAAGSSSTYMLIDLWGGKINRPNSAAAFDNHRGVEFGVEMVAFRDPDEAYGRWQG
ncbi:hypothetical protein NQ176_g3526 [Zarea fungicola]|uniref:Uncharacterized protein n=1 Tax=Zarea fungicola TaxID=93591 RepID=A0ACC1NJ72_9HYPO|nr:hypothetical protein NQ176_g3526 [Lecanicillium fungicola]